MFSPHQIISRKSRHGDNLPTRQFPNAINSWPQENASTCDREAALADIAAHGDEDNAEVAAADLVREFPRSWQTIDQMAVRI